MITYLITVNDRDAQHVDRWAETGLRLCPAEGHPGFGVAVIEVVKNPEGDDAGAPA